MEIELPVRRYGKWTVIEVPEPIVELAINQIKKQLEHCTSCDRHDDCKIVRLMTGAILAKSVLSLWKKVDEAYTEALRRCSPYINAKHLGNAYYNLYTFCRNSC